jgi:hypothetical protein
MKGRSGAPKDLVIGRIGSGTDMPNGAQKQCAKLICQVTPKEELAEPNFSPYVE